MADVWIPLGLFAGLAIVLAALWWLAARVRRRGADVLGPFDELWHPAAHRTRIERQEQAEHRAPAPSPDDQDPSAPSQPVQPSLGSPEPPRAAA
jgi:hypothetical protein